MSDPVVVVVGSANVDLVAQVPWCPRPGETLIGRSFATVPGGKGANQAVASARLGASTFFVGCVGDDVFGGLQRDTLTEAGIDVSHLRTHPTEPTGTAVITVADEGENSIVVVPSANFALSPKDVEQAESLFEKADVVLLEFEVPLETIEAALDVAHRHGVLSLLDAGAVGEVPQSIIEKADIISPNETEAKTITGIPIQTIDDAREAAAKLMEMGARTAVLKLGAHGALYMAGEDWFHVPAFEVTTIDTVAAGDAFTAALGILWRSVEHKRDAIRFANAAGALATTVRGAQPSMPMREAVEAFLAAQR